MKKLGTQKDEEKRKVTIERKNIKKIRKEKKQKK